MARQIICDICGKQSEHVVAKLYFGPVIKGSAKAYHSNYSHHLDVGECCKERLLKSFKWRERMTQQQYHQSRKNGSVKLDAEDQKKKVTTRPMRGARDGS